MEGHTYVGFQNPSRMKMVSYNLEPRTGCQRYRKERERKGEGGRKGGEEGAGGEEEMTMTGRKGGK